MIKRTRVIEIEPTPEELAREFAEMRSDDQAAFFNALAAEVKNWEYPFETQLMAIVEVGGLTPEGLALMRIICVYAEVSSHV